MYVGMSPRKLTRKQHIVTRRLLANFVDKDGVLWAYERNKAVRRSKPENECNQRDFYEYEVSGRATQNRYENWLARIESNAIPLFDLLIERRQLAPEQAVVISSFVGSLFARTRKVRDQISTAMVTKFRSQTTDPGFVRDLQHRLLQMGELRFAKDLQREVDELRTTMENSPSFYHVVGLPHRTRVVAEAIMRKSWHTIDAPSDMFFATSDCPVSTVEFADGRVLPGVGFAKENAAIFLPLTPKHVFVASRVGWPETADPRFVESLNRLTVQFAHRNVYANVDSAALQARVNAEIDCLVFGKNAFLPNN
jgi:hypothetical protein